MSHRPRLLIPLLAAIALTSSVFLLLPTHTHAAESVNLIVPIPVVGGDPVTTVPANPASYVKSIYEWGIGLAALLAMGQLVLGGVQYVISAGMPSAKHSAEERMTSAVTGLVILLCIVIILTAINPSLAIIQLPTVDKIVLQGTEPEVIEKAAAVNDQKNTAAATARNQLTGKYLQAYKAMKGEIDQQISRTDDDLQEIIGDVDIAGPGVDDVDDVDMPLSRLRTLVSTNQVVIKASAKGYDDFYEYAQLVLEAYQKGNKEEVAGYGGAITAAVNYALNCLDKDVDCKTPKNHDDVERLLLLMSVVQPDSIRNIILNGTP
jgi:hypothetical protein